MYENDKPIKTPSLKVRVKAMRKCQAKLVRRCKAEHKLRAEYSKGRRLWRRMT